MRYVAATAGLLLILSQINGAAAHGALAVGETTTDGTPVALVVNKTTADEANARALRLCQRALATTERTRRTACRIEASFENQCAVVASDKMETHIGWALGQTKADAFSAAKVKCEGAPENRVACVEYISDCDNSGRR